MDHKLLKKAISNMELLDIYLNEGAITRNKDFDYGAVAQDIRQQNKLTVTADVLGTTGDAGGTASLLRAMVTMGLRYVPNPDLLANDPESIPTTVFAEVNATFCAVYRYGDELSDKELAEFLRFNAVHNVWPFWREHVLRVAAEAKLPRPSIPLMKPNG